VKIESVNHVALQVRDAEKSAQFYQDYCGMEIVHSRQDGDIHVRWVRLPNQKDGFMIVLLETLADLSGAAGSMDHIGIYVESRKEVDDVAARAHGAGILVEGPIYAGEIVGYYCMIQDPDGNLIEFSCEQARM